MSSVGPENEHIKVLEQFREQLKQLGKYDEKRHDDGTLLRFLRARKFDLQKSEKMILDYEQWRVEFDVEGIIQNFAYPEQKQVQSLYPRFYHKTDKQGRPIYIELLGNLEAKKLFEATDQDRFLKKHVREYEKLLKYRFKACSEKQGRRIEQSCTILDLKGVPLSQFNQVRKIVQIVSGIAQNYYPETLGRMFLINAPMLFTAIWAVVKGMLDENTVAKISVLGSSYQKQLLEYIDPENLPDFLGGESKCPPGVKWEESDIGPWNNGSVTGYPIPFWEDMSKRDL